MQRSYEMLVKSEEDLLNKLMSTKMAEEEAAKARKIKVKMTSLVTCAGGVGAGAGSK